MDHAPKGLGVTLSQLSIFFKDQMDDILDSQ